MIPIEAVELCDWTLHNGKASHDALSIGCLKLPQKMSAKDIAEFDATGMLNMYPRCVLEGYHAFTAHLRVHQQSFVGITLFVSTQGCGRPQTADEQKVDAHVFRCVDYLTK
jgi:hypothetical protein